MPSRSILSAHPANFRARLLKDLFVAFAIPSAVLYALLLVNNIRLGLFAPPVYFLFFLGWATSKGAYSTYRQRKLAEQLGSKPIPCVVGKWPGNLDILLKMIGAFKTSYILDVYLQLFEEHQCTTLNLRILWGDNVSSIKEKISVLGVSWDSGLWKTLDLHTGFTVKQTWRLDQDLPLMPFLFFLVSRRIF